MERLTEQDTLYAYQCEPPEMCGSHVKSMEIIGNIHDNPEILKEASHNDRSGENGTAECAEADQENMRGQR